MVEPGGVGGGVRLQRGLQRLRGREGGGGFRGGGRRGRGDERALTPFELREGGEHAAGGRGHGGRKAGLGVGAAGRGQGRRGDDRRVRAGGGDLRPEGGGDALLRRDQGRGQGVAEGSGGGDPGRLREPIGGFRAELAGADRGRERRGIGGLQRADALDQSAEASPGGPEAQVLLLLQDHRKGQRRVQAGSLGPVGGQQVHRRSGLNPARGGSTDSGANAPKLTCSGDASGAFSPEGGAASGGRRIPAGGRGGPSPSAAPRPSARSGRTG